MPSKQDIFAMLAIIATLVAAVIGGVLARNQSLASSHILFFFLFLSGCLTLFLGLLAFIYRVRFSTTPRVPTRARIERMAKQGLGQSILAGSLLVLSGLIACAAALVSMTLPVHPTAIPTPAPTPAPVPPVIHRDDLRITINNNFYTITPLPLDEMVKGLKGGYYIVDLKSADQQKIWRFKLEQYTVPSFEKDFAQSISAFRSTVVQRLPEGAKYELFVRGSADRDLGNDFRGELVKEYNYREVVYLPSVTAEQYLFESTAVHMVSSPFTNRDLPFLRAAFMQSKLSTGESALKKPYILQGMVDDAQEKEELRNATVFLFVNWPDAPNQK